MKKLLVVVLLIFVLTLTGCFGGDSNNNLVETNSPDQVITYFIKGIEDENTTLIEENLGDNIKLTEIKKVGYSITGSEYSINDYRINGEDPEKKYQGEEWYKIYEDDVNQYYVDVVEQDSPPYIRAGYFEVLGNDELNEELLTKTTVTYYSSLKEWFVQHLSFASLGFSPIESRYFSVEITTSDEQATAVTFMGQFEEGDTKGDYYRGSIEIILLIENNKWVIDEIIKVYEIC